MAVCELIMRLGVYLVALRGALEKVERAEVEGLRGSARVGNDGPVVQLEGRPEGTEKPPEVRGADTPVAAEAFRSVVLAECTPGEEHTIRLADGLAILVRSEHGRVAKPVRGIHAQYHVNVMLFPVGFAAGHRLTACLENACPEVVVVVVVLGAPLIAELEAFKIPLEDKVGDAANGVRAIYR